MPLHKLPLIMCKKMPFSYTNFQKSPCTCRHGQWEKKTFHTLPPLVDKSWRAPLYTGIAKGHKHPCMPPPLPLIGVKETSNVNDVALIRHLATSNIANSCGTIFYWSKNNISCPGKGLKKKKKLEWEKYKFDAAGRDMKKKKKKKKYKKK